MAKGVEGLPGVDSQIRWRSDSFYGSFLTLNLETAVPGKDSHQIGKELYRGDPSILVQDGTGDKMRLFVYTLEEGDAEVIGERLREVLSS